MNSEDHRANNLNPNFTEIGIGYKRINITGYKCSFEINHTYLVIMMKFLKALSVGFCCGDLTLAEVVLILL